MKSKFRNHDMNKLVDKDRQLEIARPTKVNQNQALESMRINVSFAKIFYDFLTGVSNSLPTINSLIELYNRSEFGAITMGYGIILNKDFELSITTPVDNSKLERVDVISPRGYYANKVKVGFAEEGHDDDREIRRSVDTSKNSLFSRGRIEHLVRYLAQCEEKLKSKKEEKEVSLR